VSDEIHGVRPDVVQHVRRRRDSWPAAIPTPGVGDEYEHHVRDRISGADPFAQPGIAGAEPTIEADPHGMAAAPLLLEHASPLGRGERHRLLDQHGQPTLQAHFERGRMQGRWRRHQDCVQREPFEQVLDLCEARRTVQSRLCPCPPRPIDVAGPDEQHVRGGPDRRQMEARKHAPASDHAQSQHGPIDPGRLQAPGAPCSR
jgi:hypothetical protein